MLDLEEEFLEKTEKKEKKEKILDLEEEFLEKTEKKEEKQKIKNLYFGKDIFLIENGRIEKIDYKNIKNIDYIIKYEKEKEFYIIDRDKTKIRPYLKDLLNSMDLETKELKILKLLLTFIIIIFFILLVNIYKIFEVNTKIEKIKIEENQNKNINFSSGFIIK